VPRKKPKDERSTNEKMHAMVKAYAETCNVVRSASLAGITRNTHYRWLEKCPKYAAVFQKTKLAAAEYIESECVDRATRGWLEPVYYQGARCGSVRRFDGGLAQFLLRGMLPEKYGHKTEITGPQGAPVQAKIEVVFVKPDTVSDL
jgi:hypothetical protein